MLTVAEMREYIKNLPDDMEIVVHNWNEGEALPISTDNFEFRWVNTHDDLYSFYDYTSREREVGVKEVLVIKP